MGYKGCVVPECTNTSIRTPEKLFVSIPKNTKIRKTWLMLARRNPKDIAASTNAFMCEDHFNIQQDMTNYRQYKMGFSQTILLAKGTMPSKFDCQVDRRKRLSDTRMSGTAYIKRIKTDIDQEHSTQKKDNAMTETTAEITANTTLDCNIDKNMAMLADRNYIHSNETSNINNLTPVMSEDGAVQDIKIKVENDLSVDQGIVETEKRMNYNMVKREIAPLYVAIDEIKVEYDDAVNQDVTDQENISTEHITSSDMVCGSTTTEDFVNEDIKVEIIQEIITTEEFTNIEMMCRSTLPTDVAVNSVKVENCGVRNQDVASESTTNTDVKRGNVLLGEHYSSVDGLPSAETIHTVESSDTGVQQVTKVPDDSTRLAYHMRPQSGEKPFSCDICDKAFTVKSNLVKHLKIHSGIKPFTCHICNKAFTEKSILVEHIRIHSGLKPFSCDICNKKFTVKSSLGVHLRKHSGIKPFSCDICDKTFTVKSSLVVHRRIHSGIKPFSCDICNKRFAVKSSLVVHRRIHSGIKPFSCEVCYKTFIQKYSLTIHMRTHLAEKPFACDVCQKTFSKKHTLALHMKTHSGEKSCT